MKTRFGTKTLRLTAASAVAAGMLATSAGAASGATAPACHSSVDVASLHVELEAAKKVYRRGETARVTVTVNRAADKNVLPKAAADVNVELVLAQRMAVLLRTAGKTDELGSVTMKLKLGPKTPLGMAQVKADAWNGSDPQGPCGTRVLERGTRRNDFLFRVVR